MAKHTTIGERIAHLRSLADPPMSATELARVAGVAASHVHQIESGEIDTASERTLAAIGYATGADVAYLRHGKPSPASLRVRMHVAAARQRFVECQRVLRGEARNA